MRDIKNFILKELEVFLKEKNFPAYHAKQIFNWIYQKRVEDFSLMSPLPKDLRDFLNKRFYFTKIEAAEKLLSKDKTEKFLLKLEDNNLIEAVIIPSKERVTFCTSTQVGCKYNCLFCASAKLGFKRNLTIGEIVSQILYLKDYKKDVDNIVFMGIGEPLDNYDNLLSAIRVINDKNGLNIGARKITISTCGLIPQIERLSKENLQVELSVSLHASDDETRKKLMPINKIYPLDKLMEACRNYYKKTNRQITFEYVLLKNINSSLQDTQKLARILQGFDAKLNLMIYNKNPYSKFNAPDKQEVESFAHNLEKNKIRFTFRAARGQDIQAACGQLRVKYGKT